MRRLQRFLYPIPVVLLCVGIYGVHYIAYKVFDVYHYWPWFDAPMHLAGGVMAGLLALAILNEADRRKGENKQNREWWLVMLFILGVVSLIAIMWEFHEYFLDALAGYISGGEVIKHQPSLDDTMKDMALGLSGGLLVYLGVYKVNEKIEGRD